MTNEELKEISEDLADRIATVCGMTYVEIEDWKVTFWIQESLNKVKPKWYPICTLAADGCIETVLIQYADCTVRVGTYLDVDRYVRNPAVKYMRLQDILE